MLSGSSPLARGRPQARRQPNPRVRLIPARAGKTGQPSQSAASGSAHPRSRGENNPSSNSSRRTTGSSPLARGKQGPRNEDGLARRLIPARAGKTPPTSAMCSLTKAHPRSRGENNLSEDDSSFWRGSSPLARGKPALGEVVEGGLGLIPARAGKTFRRAECLGPSEAHPRSRGENAIFGVSSA